MELTVIKSLRDQARRIFFALDKLAAATATQSNTFALYEKGQATGSALLNANDDLYAAEIRWETVCDDCPNWAYSLEP